MNHNLRQAKANGKYYLRYKKILKLSQKNLKIIAY